MTPAPEFITNRDGNTLLAALRAALPDAPPAAPGGGLAEPAPALALAEVCIATGFVSPAGFGVLADRLEHAARIRLLLGAEPEPEAWRAARRPGDPPPVAFTRREVATGLRRLDAGLRRARDRQPYTAEARAHRRAMAALLRAGRLEARRYERGFLPAKATLLDGWDPAVVVGSSNLTYAGLTAGLELNLLRRDAAVFALARSWFDALWDAAEPFDLAALLEEPEAEWPPWLVFLRMLLQLYGEELGAEERAQGGEIRLTDFQKDGVWRARRILREFGGVLVADEVGLGKTFIAGQLLKECSDRLQRALLVCPAALRDTTWRHFLHAHGFSRRVELVSYDQLARDKAFFDAERRPQATGDVLREPPSEYALVVVDEAHNYRSPDAATRAAVLRRLLAGPRRDLVLLSATPVNNGLWDLYHLLRFFLRGDGALAARGVVSVHDRFRQAARLDPSDLDPDFLYPVIDAVTVKRTRAFVKRHYAHDTIRSPDGRLRPIVFPKAVAIPVRYDLDRAAPGLFDAVAAALDPAGGGDGLLAFARYAPDAYRRGAGRGEAEEAAETAAGLLRSGLLKRFESSAHAFRLSLGRMVREHDAFLAQLDRGRVLGAAALRALGDDEELPEAVAAATDAAGYDAPRLRAAVARDRAILAALAERVTAAAAREEDDPKLAAVAEALAQVAAQAREDAATSEDERRDRKVLVFSYFADTVEWLRGALERRVEADPRLAAYRGRVAAAAGRALEGEEEGRAHAAWGFAPETTDPPPHAREDRFDLLVSTDVLAEGINLQQCRHILNWDLPWNPMRLVQRHGRIDRIGSPHPRVFLRTVFPADRLEALLALEARILRKLTAAARSIGVATMPVEGPDAGAQVFAETRAEIERLARGDASIFERGGTAAAAMTGEEYRHRLRAALLNGREAIKGLPGGAGSGMRKGARRGVLFCAEVELADGSRRTFLRFVPATPAWRVADGPVLREVGTCLRLGDCDEATPRHVPPALTDGIFAFWDAALADVLREWDALTDPANLQPAVRPLNRQVAAFLRASPSPEVTPGDLARALDVLESPWPRRDEALLRAAFAEREGASTVRAARLVRWVLDTGLEPSTPPPPLPAARAEDVRLVCWLAVEPAAPTPAG